MEVIKFKDLVTKEEVDIKDLIPIKVRNIKDPDGKLTKKFIIFCYNPQFKTWDTFLPLSSRYKMITTASVVKDLHDPTKYKPRLKAGYSNGFIRALLVKLQPDKLQTSIDSPQLRSYLRSIISSPITNIDTRIDLTIENSYNGIGNLRIMRSVTVIVTTTDNDPVEFQVNSLIRQKPYIVKHNIARVPDNIESNIQYEELVSKLKTVNVSLIEPLLVSTIGKVVTKRILDLNDGNMTLLDFVILAFLFNRSVSENIKLEDKFDKLYNSLSV